MISFFAKHARAFMSGIMICVVVTMLFYGMGSKTVPQGRELQDQVFVAGKGEVKREVKKRQIDAMKAYLKFDLGYGFSKVLERQNIFANGFFIRLLDSSFGRGLADEYFSKVEGDFAKQVKKHRRQRLYRHDSGATPTEDVMKKYAPDYYESYAKVADKKRVIDASLLQDMISLMAHQQEFTPRNLQMLTTIYMQDILHLDDPAIERRNFAMFQARDNEDVFGNAFMELFAQAIIEGAAFAKEKGFNVSYEEAQGVVYRRARDVLAAQYYDLEDEHFDKVFKNLEGCMGLSKKEIVKAAQAIMVFEKMFTCSDNALVYDRFAFPKLFGDKVVLLDASVVEESRAMVVTSVKEALELDLYLSSIGEASEFLQVPEKCFEMEKIQKETPILFTESYVLKVARRTLEDIGKEYSIKKVWSYQTSDEGWKALCEKFSFAEDLSKDERFDLLQTQEAGKKLAVDKFSREKMAASDIALIEKTLEKQPLTKGVLQYNSKVSTKNFGLDFDEAKLIEKLNALEEGEEISCYTQDQKQFFRFVLVKKSEGPKLSTFAQAKKAGILTQMIEDSLEAQARGEISESMRGKLYYRMLQGRAGKAVAEEIKKCEEEKKLYEDHMMKRLNAAKSGKVFHSDDSHLSIFNLVQSRHTIDKKGQDKDLAKDSFFKLAVGDVSNIEYNKGIPFFITVKKRKINEGNLKTMRKRLTQEMEKEARKNVYQALLSHFVSNEMLISERFN